MKAKVPLTKAEEDRFGGSRGHIELSDQRPGLASEDLASEDLAEKLPGEADLDKVGLAEEAKELQPVVLRLIGLPEATEQATDDKLGFLDGKS